MAESAGREVQPEFEPRPVFPLVQVALPSLTPGTLDARPTREFVDDSDGDGEDAEDAEDPGDGGRARDYPPFARRRARAFICATSVSSTTSLPPSSLSSAGGM